MIYRPLLILLLTATIFYSKSVHGQILNKPRQVVVTGKIDNHEPGRQLMLYVNKLGFGNDAVVARVDSNGNFLAVFDSYTPTDIWITYQSNFLVLVHPGDSIYVKFDGRYSNRKDVLKTVIIKGARAKTNNYAIDFQKRYWAYWDDVRWNKNNSAVKDYNEKRYRLRLDTIRRGFETLYQQFVAEVKPDKESSIWSKLYADMEYYERMAYYASDHREANEMSMSNNWDVSKGFFSDLSSRLPIEPSMLISGYAITTFATRYTRYVADKQKGNIDEGAGVMAGAVFGVPNRVDSVRIDGILKYVDDGLLKQAMLTDYFNNQLLKSQIEGFERHRKLIDQQITLPFLKVPLHEVYRQTKTRLEMPNVYTEAVLKELNGLSIKQVVDSIMLANKNKVIYIDTWATWCGPCLSQMPDSKIIEQQLKNKDVAFIYLCESSQRPEWKATLAKYQLGGQHYFLNDKQSAEFNKLFGINGIPFYILIDKHGVVIDKGNQLSPLSAKDKILALLDK